MALLEATSFLVLLAVTYIKYASDSPTGVHIMGPIHGILFVAYVLIALNVRGPARWSVRTTLGVLLGADLPFGGFVVDRWLATTMQPDAADLTCWRGNRARSRGQPRSGSRSDGSPRHLAEPQR